MEAQVDILKLQLLNERINQTLDALNQVRMSVRGLSHALPTSVPYGYGYAAPPYPFTTGYGGMQQAVPFTVPGLQHSPTLIPQMVPVTGLGLEHASAAIAKSPGFVGGAPLPFGNVGLMHTSPESLQRKLVEERIFDPRRIVQTFPYAFNVSTPTWSW